MNLKAIAEKVFPFLFSEVTGKTETKNPSYPVVNQPDKRGQSDRIFQPIGVGFKIDYNVVGY